jgi:serine/threonine protein kinase
MGSVYRARDPKFRRDVAIKVLPPDFAKDPDRLQRFEQKAQAIGILNHPNILSLLPEIRQTTVCAIGSNVIIILQFIWRPDINSKKRRRSARFKRISAFNRHRHEFVVRSQIEQFFSIPAPPRAGASGSGDSPSFPAVLESCNIYFNRT